MAIKITDQNYFKVLGFLFTKTMGKNKFFSFSTRELGQYLDINRESIRIILEKLVENKLIKVEVEMNTTIEWLGKGKVKVKKETSSFVPPDALEVTAYALTIGFELDGNTFVDFYESRGWLIGKVKMKSWKASVRTWKARHNSQGSGNVSIPTTFNYSQQKEDKEEWVRIREKMDYALNRIDHPLGDHEKYFIDFYKNGLKNIHDRKKYENMVYENQKYMDVHNSLLLGDFTRG